MITGIDLVEWQLRVANGEPLPATQDSLTINGHAFEARIYAEDVPAGFLPVTGTIDYMSMSQLARIDSGVREKDVISPWYDPIISKVIVWGPTREVALNRMVATLDECNISGTVTNLAFLSALFTHEDFELGNVDTGLIDRDLDKLLVTSDLTFIDWAIAAVIAKGSDDNDHLSGWSLWAPLKQSVWLQSHRKEHELLVAQTSHNSYTVTGETENLDLVLEQNSPNTVTILGAENQRTIRFVKNNDGVTLFSENGSNIFEITAGYSHGDADESAGNEILSPMPGVVKVLNTSPQSDVKAGDVLVIIEAMKMEHSLTASRDGVVSDVLIKAGQQVEAGEVLLILEDADA